MFLISAPFFFLACFSLYFLIFFISYLLRPVLVPWPRLLSVCVYLLSVPWATNWDTKNTKSWNYYSPWFTRYFMLNVDFCHKKEDSTIFGGNQVIKRCKLSSSYCCSLTKRYTWIYTADTLLFLFQLQLCWPFRCSLWCKPSAKVEWVIPHVVGSHKGFIHAHGPRWRGIFCRQGVVYVIGEFINWGHHCRGYPDSLAIGKYWW